jgi:hypothetical protein
MNHKAVETYILNGMVAVCLLGITESVQSVSEKRTGVAQGMLCSTKMASVVNEGVGMATGC